MQDKIKVSLREAGELLGFSYPTMLELAHQEDFPAFKCMGRWIVPYDRLLSWIDRQAEQKSGVVV
jgi:predicted DNA-binding transcriptional regulator AlpA